MSAPAEPSLSAPKLADVYKKIAESTPAQEANYAEFLRGVGEKQIAKWKKIAEELQLELNVQTGRIRYKEGFTPLDLNMELCYVRHGKTQGNTEPRVFQGMVDYANNQLTELGRQQAVEAAEKLERLIEESQWQLPDLIVSSPLQRALDTAAPFKEKHKDVKFVALTEAAEMKFGLWDNQKVFEMPVGDISHLFYLKQNSLVKTFQPHKVQTDQWVHPERLKGATEIESENFIECINRQKETLLQIEAEAAACLQPNENRKPRVVLYGHSMAGAAVSILLGFGKEDSEGYLGFDGSFIMPNATPTLLIPTKRCLNPKP